jgi:hypothetical protein
MGAFMDRRDAEHIIYRTATVGQLVAALIESRDHTDIRRIFEHHEGGSRAFEIACQRLGISKSDWDYANNVAGFHSLVGIIGDKLKLPRYDPAAEQARREKVSDSKLNATESPKLFATEKKSRDISRRGKGRVE